MVWTINYSDVALKKFKKLDKQNTKKIINYLEEKVKPLANPRMLGKGLGYEKAELWRYRVEDYRIICQINDEEITVLVIDLGHRRDIYD